jgi:sialate O-acetylesterase
VKSVVATLLVFIVTAAAYGQGFAGMPSIFSDNMILQQKTGAPFWGKSKVDGELKITASWGAEAKTKVVKGEAWMVKLKTPKAGGPYEVKIKIGDSSYAFKNVLIGEVWVCSGQSNMEMPLEGWQPKDTIRGGFMTIQNSANPNIRLFSVTRTFSNKRQENCPGVWAECAPATVAKFSATAYYFGKKLYDELKIPVGLIHTSWGGTAVESWISADYLKEMSAYKPVIDKLGDCDKEIEKQTAWLNEHKTIDESAKTGNDKWENLEFEDADCSKADYNDAAWPEMKLPAAWESRELGDYDGVVWFRKKVEIPEAWKNKDLVLELGPIDDMDRSYVNGVLAGASEKEGLWQIDRIYNIPKEAVTGTTLVIAVRVLDNQGGGGIYGLEEKLKVHPKESDEKITLAGNWKYLPVAEYKSGKFFVFGAKGEAFLKRPKMSVGLSAYTPTSLFNAMINPLIPFGIKGAIWYQGEANTGNPQVYSDLLKMMVANWRKEWKQGDFPFYYVQIAPFNYGEGTKSQLLREAQFNTMPFKNTGMAVTLDIGNPVNIHPDNKIDVGQRLARWALAKDYGKKIPFSGPVYKSMKITGDKIELSFAYAEKGLQLKPADGKNNFMIAGSDKAFKPAVVEIKGNRLIVSSPEIKNPAAVRYAWSNIEAGTLFNGAGLPASSFRTDNWEE